MASFDEAIDAQLPLGRHEHDPGRRHAEHLDAPVAEHGEELHHVEVIDERVGQLDPGF